MRAAVVVGVLVAMAVGVALGWSARAEAAQQELGQVTLAHTLERIALVGNGLSVVPAGCGDRLERLLWRDLESGVRAAQTIAANGARLPAGFAAPNLLEGVRRAGAAATVAGRDDLAAALSGLSAAIAATP